MAQTHAAEGPAEFTISLQSASAPVTISWEIDGVSEYQLLRRIGDDLVQLGVVRGAGRVIVKDCSPARLVLRLEAGGDIPREFALDQNYPNPFNPTTSLRFALPVQSFVRAEIFNLLGQKVKSILSDHRKAGVHTLVWDGHGDSGQPLGSGPYFLRLDARGTGGESFTATRKLLLIK